MANQKKVTTSKARSAKPKDRLADTAKKKKAGIYNIVIAVCALVFVGSMSVLVYQMMQYWNASSMRDTLENLIVEQPSIPEGQQATPETQQEKYQKLYERNPDFIGWISIPDTPISYPVVQTVDNDRYLYTNFDGNNHKLGTVFADTNATFSLEYTSDNPIIYGHSAADGSYFAALLKYKDLDYYKEHPYIQFDTLYDQNEWVIIGALAIDALDNSKNAFWYHEYIDFTDETMYNEFITEVTQRSYITTNVDTVYGDKFITLSTCGYDFNEERFAIIARKIRPGEPKENFAIESAVTNQNRVMPDRWYR